MSAELAVPAAASDATDATDATDVTDATDATDATATHRARAGQSTDALSQKVCLVPLPAASCLLPTAS